MILGQDDFIMNHFFYSEGSLYALVHKLGPQQNAWNFGDDIFD